MISVDARKESSLESQATLLQAAVDCGRRLVLGFISSRPRGPVRSRLKSLCLVPPRSLRLIGAVPEEAVTDVSEISRLESTHPKMSFLCRFRRAFFTVILRVLLILAGMRFRS